VGDSSVTPTATAIDVTNGLTLANTQADRTVLVVTNTDSSAHAVTIVAGDSVGGAGSQQPQTFSVPASSSVAAGPFESARVQQADGSLQLNFVAGHAGTVTALQMPRGF
jgi:hypothetical protein